VSIASRSTRSKSASSTVERPCAGRFAPSPTGPLHLGSLLAATASYVDARAAGGRWLLRIDDLDTPRNRPGAETSILRSLEAHGLLWDGPVARQSEHLELYRAALNELTAHDLVFYCRCSRRQLEPFEVYPGTCRRHRSPRSNAAVRVEVDATVISFDDLVRGSQRDVLAVSTGDFVVRRRDGFYAYQLATAVDDGQPEITRVVRGSDLLEETPKQIFLMQRLGLEPPIYAHVPTLLHPDGTKLSKQTGAPALAARDAARSIARVLRVLGVELPEDADGWSAETLLEFGVRAWRLDRVPGRDVACDAGER